MFSSPFPSSFVLQEQGGVVTKSNERRVRTRFQLSRTRLQPHASTSARFASSNRDSQLRLFPPRRPHPLGRSYLREDTREKRRRTDLRRGPPGNVCTCSRPEATACRPPVSAELLSVINFARFLVPATAHLLVESRRTPDQTANACSTYSYTLDMVGVSTRGRRRLRLVPPVITTIVICHIFLESTKASQRLEVRPRDPWVHAGIEARLHCLRTRASHSSASRSRGMQVKPLSTFGTSYT